MTELTPYHEDQELDNNTSDNTHFRDILEQHITRRSLIAKTASGVTRYNVSKERFKKLQIPIPCPENPEK